MTNGPLSLALFAVPTSAVTDNLGNIYVVDVSNVIRMISNGKLVSNSQQTLGYVSTFISAGFFKEISGLAIDPQNNLVVADIQLYAIYRVNTVTSNLKFTLG